MKTFEIDFNRYKSSICIAKDYSELKARLKVLGLYKPAIVIADIKVSRLYREHLSRALHPLKLKWVHYENGESGKNLDGYVNLVSKIDGLEPTRKTPIIAFGGGVTGDMAGFVASTMLRGMPWVQLPTSLLAMVDASVGGKVGVNTHFGKNRLGNFYQPPLVYMALNTLQTLEDDEIRSGLGEIIKHTLIRDKSGFEELEGHGQTILNRDPEILAKIIFQSVRIKAAVVEADEREEGVRAILNFGHTVGHALESVLGFGELRHGECVGIGILAELLWTCQEYSESLEIYERTAKLLDKLGLPLTVSGVNKDQLIAAAMQDKKIDHDIIKLTRVSKIGSANTVSYPTSQIKQLFNYFSETT